MFMSGISSFDTLNAGIARSLIDNLDDNGSFTDEQLDSLEESGELKNKEYVKPSIINLGKLIIDPNDKEFVEASRDYDKMLAMISIKLQGKLESVGRTLTPEEIDAIIYEVTGLNVEIDEEAETQAEIYAMITDSKAHEYT